MVRSFGIIAQDASQGFKIYLLARWSLQPITRISLDLHSNCNYNYIYFQGYSAVYAWDDEKNQENLAKHGLSFEDAELVFRVPCVTFDDDRFDYDEDRFLTLGLLQSRVVLIAYTWREDRIRIISMRKATRREQEIYQKRLGQN